MLHLIFVSTVIATALSHNHYHSYDPPPPSQDQCKNVNATEPVECPNHIGPPWYAKTYYIYTKHQNILHISLVLHVIPIIAQIMRNQIH